MVRDSWAEGPIVGLITVRYLDAVGGFAFAFAFAFLF
jgi:hypothetical protein